MQASQDGDPELVKILCEAQNVDLDHHSKVSYPASSYVLFYHDIVILLLSIMLCSLLGQL